MQEELVITEDITLEKFRKAWTAELSGRLKTLLWEGVGAYEEMIEAGYSGVIRPNRPTETILFKPLTSRVFREIQNYRRLSGDIVRMNRCYEDVTALIPRLVGSIKKTHLDDCHVKASLERELNNWIAYFEDRAVVLKEEHASQWRRTYLASAEEWGSWSLEPGNIGAGRTIRGTPPAELAEYENKFSRVLAPKKMQKNIDLDGYFQLRVAFALRQYLPEKRERMPPVLRQYGFKSPGISLSTISRLVVLSYIAAKLVTEVKFSTRKQHTRRKTKPETVLVVDGCNRELSPSSVFQKLRSAGIK